MRLLIKYILKKSFPPFLIGLGGFIVFVSVEILYQLSYVIVRNRVGFDKLLLLIYYYLPYFISMGIPVGVLLAIFWTISELSERNELMAFQVHGISLKNLIIPFLIMSAILSGISYFLNDSLVPKTQVKIDEVMAKYIYKRAKVESYLVEDTVVKYDNKYIYVGEYNKKKNVMKDILIIDYSGGVKKITSAKEAVREKNYWYLIDGRFYLLEKDGRMKLDSTFKKLKLKMEEDLGRMIAYQSPKKMSHEELVDVIRSIKDKKRAAKWVVELHTRYSTALAPIIIVLVGLSFSLLFNLTSKSWGVILTFVLVVLYQGSSAWLSAMGKEYMINPVLSAWLPNIIFSSIGLLIFVFIDTRSVQRFREIMTKFFLIALILLPLNIFGANYDVKSDFGYFGSDSATFTGNVEIYENGEKIIEASTVVYYFNENILFFYDATKLTDSGWMEFSTAVVYEDFGQGYGVYDGVFHLKEGAVSITSASMVVYSKVVKEYFLYGSKAESYKKSEKIVSTMKFVLMDTSDMNNVKILDSMGKISITKKDGENVEGFVVSYKDEEAKGFIGWVKTRVKGKWKKLYISGLEIFFKKEYYILKGGYITTCDDLSPHYYIMSEYSQVHLGKYYVARNVIFTLFDVPIFYFPFFFQFLEDPPPVKFSVKFSSKSTARSFSFYTKYSDTGKVSFSVTTTEDNPPKYKLNISDKIFGNSFNYSHSLENGKQSYNLKLMPYFSKKTYFQISGSSSGSLKYILSGKFSIYGLSTVLKIQRNYSNGNISWIIPDIVVKSKKYNFYGFNFQLPSLRYKGTLSYSEDDGDIFKNYKDTKHSLAWKFSLSRYIYKQLGTSISFAEIGNLTYESTDLTALNTTDTFKLQLFSKSFDFKVFKFTSSRYVQFQSKHVLDEETVYNISEGEKHTFSWNIFKFFYGKAVYNRSSAYTKNEGEDEFNQTSSTNKVDLDVNLTPVFIPLFFNVKTVYDFIKDEKNWSYPDLTGKLDLKFGDWRLSFSTKTKWYYDRDEEQFEKIDFTFTQTYKSSRFKNTVSFTYNLNEEKPVEEINDSFKASGLKLFGYTSSFSGNLKYNIDPNVLKYFYIKGTFKKGKVSHVLNLKYTSSLDETYKDVYLKYSYKASDPKISLSGRFNYKDDKWTIPTMSVSLTKLLHKWSFSASVAFSLVDELNFSKFTISFKLVDFPDKYFNYDILGDEFDFGVM